MGCVNALKGATSISTEVEYERDYDERYVSMP